MEEAYEPVPRNSALWRRALYMLFYGLAYAVTRLLLAVLVIVQFILVLISGHTNEPLRTLGCQLSTYVFALLQFLTFNSETTPFPFSEWPDDQPGPSPWSDPRPPRMRDDTAEQADKLDPFRAPGRDPDTSAETDR